MFTSGSADVRAAAFKRAWSDPTVAALIAVRGGYGSVQLLPMFDSWQPQDTPKLFIGYSDNTSLLTWLTCHCGMTALHGPISRWPAARWVPRGRRGSLLRLWREPARPRLQPIESVVKASLAEGPLFVGT